MQPLQEDLLESSAFGGAPKNSCSSKASQMQSCDRLFSAEYLRAHLKRLEEKPSECTFCKKIFKNPLRLAYHKRHQCHPRPPEGTHDRKCSYCGRGFATITLLKIHERIHTAERPFKCPNCEAGFRTRLYLELHSVVQDQERDSNDLLSKCDHCDESFKRPVLLKLHMRRVHLTRKPFKCTHCDAAFLSAANLGKHRRTHQKLANELWGAQTEKKSSSPRVCPDCGKTIVSNFGRHRNVHLGIKPHQCNECGKCFVRPTALRNHERLHTGKKPYKCTYCEKSFTVSRSLLLHKRIHTGEKPYSCLDCNKSFTRSSSLKSHKRHGRCPGKDARKCSQCGRVFSSVVELKKHEKSHCQEENHK